MAEEALSAPAMLIAAAEVALEAKMQFEAETVPLTVRLPVVASAQAVPIGFTSAVARAPMVVASATNSAETIGFISWLTVTCTGRFGLVPLAACTAVATVILPPAVKPLAVAILVALADTSPP